MLQNTTNNLLTVTREGRHQAQIIAVTSGKGGVGKSTLSVNMGLMMHRLNRKVLIVDADIHLGNVDFILGIRPRYNISHVIQGEIAIEEAIVHLDTGIDILPAASAVSEMINMGDQLIRKLSRLFKGLEDQYDVILFDTGAGVSSLVLSFVVGADKAIVLATPDPSSLADAYAVSKMIWEYNKDMPILFTANMVRSHEEGDELFKKMNVLTKRFLFKQLIFGGSILRDEMIAQSVKRQRPFVIDQPNSSSTKALRMANQRILKQPFDQEHSQIPFFERFILSRKKILESER